MTSKLKTLSRAEKLEYMQRKWGELEKERCYTETPPTKEEIHEEIDRLSEFGEAFEETEKRREYGVINSDEM